MRGGNAGIASTASLTGRSRGKGIGAGASGCPSPSAGERAGLCPLPRRGGGEGKSTAARVRVFDVIVRDRPRSRGRWRRPGRASLRRARCPRAAIPSPPNSGERVRVRGGNNTGVILGLVPRTHRATSLHVATVTCCIQGRRLMNRRLAEPWVLGPSPRMTPRERQHGVSYEQLPHSLARNGGQSPRKGAPITGDAAEGAGRIASGLSISGDPSSMSCSDPSPRVPGQARPRTEMRCGSGYSAREPGSLPVAVVRDRATQTTVRTPDNRRARARRFPGTRRGGAGAMASPHRRAPPRRQGGRGRAPLPRLREIDVIVRDTPRSRGRWRRPGRASLRRARCPRAAR